MKIIQTIECLAYGDGMGNHTILTHHLLKQAGYHVETYAGSMINVPPGVAKPYWDGFSVERDDVVLFHCGGWSPVAENVVTLPCRKIMVYHNITPPNFFVGYHFLNYKVTSDGYSLVKQWARDFVFDAVLAFSKYNYDDLIKLGFSKENTFYFPGYLIPMLEYKEMPDEDMMEDFSDGIPNILFVGRIAPNKKQEDIVRAFAYYQNHIDRSARLIFVGGGENDAYCKAIKQYIENLELENVIFPGHISSAALIALYQCADVFVCMSEHEGFCIPLIEAMLFDVPVLAYNATAVPDTLGDAGILLDKKEPAYVAKWIERVVNDKNLRKKILDGQRKRLKYYDQKIAGQKMLDFLRDFIEENITKYQLIDSDGIHERDIGALVDDSLYRFCEKKLAGVGKRLLVSREEYMNLMKKER